MQDPVQSTEQKSETVHLHIYPGKERSSFEWYMDDGETYGYQSGACVTRTLHSENGKITLSASNGNFVPSWKHIRVVLHGVSDGGSMICNGKHVKTETIQHSYFLPMLKFDPLESAPDVGSESVQQFVIPYTPEEVVIAFPPI
jgi:alpha-glucosidase